MRFSYLKLNRGSVRGFRVNAIPEQNRYRGTKAVLANCLQDTVLSLSCRNKELNKWSFLTPLDTMSPKWEDFDKSDRQVRRYIRLTELVTPLLDKVDDKSIPVSAGTELSFLDVKDQSQVNDYSDVFELRASHNVIKILALITKIVPVN